MRTIKSLSHTSLKAFYEDRETFVLERLAEDRIDRDPQGQPGAIGSAFDAYEKSSLALCLYGNNRPQYLEFETLFEAQVEPQNRDLARKDGLFVWNCYATSGQHFDLLKELEESPEDPVFEFDELTIIDGVPVTTKPDLKYRTKSGVQVILDWKVRSFYSKSGASPTQCYRRCRFGASDKVVKEDGLAHKKYRPMMHGGMEIHSGSMSEASPVYADQTTLYSWAAGVPLGGDFIAAIDEIIARPSKGDVPNIRVSELRAMVSREHQADLHSRLLRCWNAIQTGHIFDELTLEESQSKQRILENAAKSMGGEEGQYFARLGKKSFY